MNNIIYLVECKVKVVNNFYNFLLKNNFKKNIVEDKGKYDSMCFLIDLSNKKFILRGFDYPVSELFNLKDIKIKKISMIKIKKMISGKTEIIEDEIMTKILKELKSINKKLGKKK